MAHLDNLISGIADSNLRVAIQNEYRKVLGGRQFGLVYNSHRPESVLLPGFTIRRGDKVRVLADGTGDRTNVDDSGVWTVASISGELAAISSRVDPTLRKKLPKDRIVVTREFGDPIFPGLRSVGKVETGGLKPWSAVINGENFHALEALLYPYESQVDVIYIDPPYNTGAKDWKYNNDYVDADDQYRHSKWLSFMEKRLELAKRLLNPRRSALIVTIDEKEVHRLGLLLGQVFRGYNIQMVSITISPRGTSRATEFSRIDEYAFVVFLGDAGVAQPPGDGEEVEVRWKYLRRNDIQSARDTRPRQFYPIYVNTQTERIVHLGKALKPEESLNVPHIDGAIPVWPIREDGVHMNWGLTAPSLQKALDAGYVRVTAGTQPLQAYTIAYLTAPNIKKAETGVLTIAGTRSDGSKIVRIPGGKTSRPTTVWRERSHDAGAYGTSILGRLIPGRKFPFPKSLYAVEDTIRFFAADNPNALVMDFFGGSGTTAHAVARLNHQDGGSRRSIVVTNNEVSDQEGENLREKGIYPGDVAWEALGICKYITIPRITAAITGITPDGAPVEDSYKFVDEFPMANGFEENIEFFDLTYEDPTLVSLGRKFKAVAPLLWLKAGAIGSRIDDVASNGWSVPEKTNYGILFDTREWSDFVDAVNLRQEHKMPLAHAFIVTDSGAEYRQIVAKLDAALPSTRLYADYLRTFEINTAGDE